jgi:hypothetical protein
MYVSLIVAGLRRNCYAVLASASPPPLVTVHTCWTTCALSLLFLLLFSFDSATTDPRIPRFASLRSLLPFFFLCSHQLLPCTGDTEAHCTVGTTWASSPLIWLARLLLTPQRLARDSPQEPLGHDGSSEYSESLATSTRSRRQCGRAVPSTWLEGQTRLLALDRVVPLRRNCHPRHRARRCLCM